MLPDPSALPLRRPRSATRTRAPAATRKVREKRPGRPRRRQSAAADLPFRIIVPFADVAAQNDAEMTNLLRASLPRFRPYFPGRLSYDLSNQFGGHSRRKHGPVALLLDFQAVQGLLAVRIWSLPCD